MNFTRMGVCLSHEDKNAEIKAKRHSDLIDKTLNQIYQKQNSMLKILLLGASESGKSTLIKQMKIIYTNGFNEKELYSFKIIIFENLIVSMKLVLTGMGMLLINLEDPRNRIHAEIILSCKIYHDENQNVYPSTYHALKSLWADPAVKRVADMGNKFDLNDSAIYFFSNMDRICSPYYQPTEADVLRSRVETLGVIETYFRIENVIIRMFDVGGQRTERKKWIQCFDDVHALLFVASLTDFDTKILENSRTTRLEENIKMFGQICGNAFFKTTSTILLLNKIDVFQEKILKKNCQLRYFYPEYRGLDFDVNNAVNFILSLFMKQSQKFNKVIYAHVTNATDTSNIQTTFFSVVNSILKINLSHTNLL